MASSNSGAGYAGAAELRRRGELRPGGLCRCMLPPQPEERRHSASRLCPWTLAPARTSQGGSRFIAGVTPAPPARSRAAPAGRGGAQLRPLRCCAARSPGAAAPAAADAVVSSRGCES